MKYLKTLALLSVTLSVLTSCTQGFEDFPAEVYSINEATEANGTKATEPNDSTGVGMITLNIDEPEVQDIDYTITIP